MHCHHLGKRIDVKSVLGGSVSQCNGYCDRQLFEHRVEYGEPRHKFGAGGIAVVDFAYRGLVNRAAQVDLKDFRVTVSLPGRDRIAGCETTAARPNELLVPRTTVDSARDFGRTG